MSEIVTQRIAQQLKTLRKQHGLSLDKTADATGVSKAMLGQIERQESSPTIATLWKIATGLNCSLSFLMESQHMPTNTSEYNNDPNMCIKTLFPFDEITRFETFEITLSDKHEQLSLAHNTGVSEHIYVTKGNIAVFYDNKWHNLENGSRCRFEANQTHGYKAISDKAVFIDIIHYR